MLTEEIKQEKAEKIRQLFAKLTNWEEVETITDEKLLPWSFDTYFNFDVVDNIKKITRYNNKFFSRHLDMAILCAEIQLIFEETESPDSHYTKDAYCTKFCVNFSLWEKTGDDWEKTCDKFDIHKNPKFPIQVKPIMVCSEDPKEEIKEYMEKYPALFNSIRLKDILSLVKEMEDEEITL